MHMSMAHAQDNCGRSQCSSVLSLNAAGNGLEECTERPLASSEAFYDSSPDDIFVYFQTEDSE